MERQIQPKVAMMTTPHVVAGIFFVFAIIFFGLARWIKLSENQEGDTDKLFAFLSLLLVVGAFVSLMVDSPNFA